MNVKSWPSERVHGLNTECLRYSCQKILKIDISDEHCAMLSRTYSTSDGIREIKKRREVKRATPSGPLTNEDNDYLACFQAAMCAIQRAGENEWSVCAMPKEGRSLLTAARRSLCAEAWGQTTRVLNEFDHKLNEARKRHDLTKKLRTIDRDICYSFSSFERFSRRVNQLYQQRRLQLYSTVTDEKALQNAQKEMEDLFNRYLEKATDLIMARVRA